MELDVLFDPFGATWADLLDGARTAQAAGFGAVWTYDHLAGSVHGADRVLEAWTTMTALAVAVPRIAVGALVLNVANRDPGTLGAAAATFQEISGGRLFLGLGAGGGPGTPYAAEQVALGRSVAPDPVRRRAVADAVATFRTVWTGRPGGVPGFLQPSPPPPVIIGGFGPRMAALAGSVGDGINLPAGGRLPELIDVARRAHAQVGRDPAAFVVTASAAPSRRAAESLTELGVDRLIARVTPPYRPGVERAAAGLGLMQVEPHPPRPTSRSTMDRRISTGTTDRLKVGRSMDRQREEAGRATVSSRGRSGVHAPDGADRSGALRISNRAPCSSTAPRSA